MLIGKDGLRKGSAEMAISQKEKVRVSAAGPLPRNEKRHRKKEGEKEEDGRKRSTGK